MPSCPDPARISDHLDGLLNGSEAREISDHLALCLSCQAVLKKFRALGALARASYENLPLQANDAYFANFAEKISSLLAQEPLPTAAAPAPFPEGDLFASEPESVPKMDSSEAAGISIPAFIAARRESSQLFSMEELRRLAGKARPAPATRPEGSGFLNVRNLAVLQQNQTRQVEEAAPDLLPFGGEHPSSPLGGGMVLPPEQKSGRKIFLFTLLGMALAFALAFLVVFYLIPTRDTPPERTPLAANTPTAEAPAPPSGGPAEEVKSEAGKETVGETGSGTEVAALSPSEEGKENKDTANSVRNDPKASAKPSKEPAAAPSKNETAAAPSTPPPPEPATPKETGGKKANADELDELLSGGSKSSGGGGSTASGPPTLTNAQIQAVMSRANVSSCKAIGTGKVSVKVTISSSGSVTNVSADGTPLGNCVAGIIRRLKFPSISSPSQTFPYPVFVR